MPYYGRALLRYLGSPLKSRSRARIKNPAITAVKLALSFVRPGFPTRINSDP
jgi:hypothetical protein